MIEKKLEISMLYDFYSQLLTDKQKDMIDLYYNQDLSLGEIAEEFKVSRQAVYDTIKRTEKILYNYEEKLKLFQLFHSKMSNVEKIQKKVLELEKNIDNNLSREKLKESIKDMKDLFDDLLNN
ncbi:MAG: putative DNA-binding protein [Clostridiaceae bacterium]|nr:putative DNA-binding protein [Clostridiaceae bacterium]